MAQSNHQSSESTSALGNCNQQTNSAAPSQDVAESAVLSQTNKSASADKAATATPLKPQQSSSAGAETETKLQPAEVCYTPAKGKLLTADAVKTPAQALAFLRSPDTPPEEKEKFLQRSRQVVVREREKREKELKARASPADQLKLWYCAFDACDILVQIMAKLDKISAIRPSTRNCNGCGAREDVKKHLLEDSTGIAGSYRACSDCAKLVPPACKLLDYPKVDEHALEQLADDLFEAGHMKSKDELADVPAKWLARFDIY
jgi:hypothetical protein